MTDQYENSLATPHILIVDTSSIFRGRLGQIFRGADISFEGATNADSALKKLSEGDPPITGVLTDALRGDYRQVIEAARQVGANVVLMTGSSLTLSQVQSEGITAFLQSRLIGDGDSVEPRTIDTMVSALSPQLVR